MVALPLLLVVVAGVPGPLTASEVYKRASPSVVALIAADEKEKDRVVQGSGVVLGPRTIVTNWHVVESGPVVIVKTAPTFGNQTGEIGVALLVAEDSTRDLAVLRLLDLRVGPKGDLTRGPPSLTPARVSRRAVEVGERVLAIGSPQGLELSLSDGLVSQVREGQQGRLIQTTAAISHGSSGGGLFDERAELVGFTTLSVEGGQNLNFAIPAQSALALLAGGFSARGAQRLCVVPAELREEFLKQFDPRALKNLAKLQAQHPCQNEAGGDSASPDLPEPGPPLERAPSGPVQADLAPDKVPVAPGSLDVSPIKPPPTTVVQVTAPVEPPSPVAQVTAPVEPLPAPPPMPPLVSADSVTPKIAPAHVTLEPEPQNTAGAPRRLAWIPAVAAGGLLAAGGVFFGLAKGAEADLRNPATQIANEAEAGRVVRAGRDYQTASFVLFGGGLLAAATAGAMYIFSPPTNAPSVSLLVAPTGFAVGVRGDLP